MNSTGSKRERSNYLVVLLLLVGLTAFSHSMNDLTEIHQLTLDASHLVAQWSADVAPAQIPQTAIRLESCESKKAKAEAAELPWLEDVEETTEPIDAPALSQHKQVRKIERRITLRTNEVQIAESKKARRFEFDPVKFEVRIPTGQLSDRTESTNADFQFNAADFQFKGKNRKQNNFRFNTRDREILLKTLNRSINLRIAS
jgi:hypothetical protein